jgi:hypothetical protein
MNTNRKMLSEVKVEGTDRKQALEEWGYTSSYLANCEILYEMGC